MYNHINIIGYLGQDPNISTFESGRKVAVYSVATSEEYKDKEGQSNVTTQWHNVAAWGYLAEKPIKKGSLVNIIGKMVYRKYTDKNNIERTIAEVIPSRVDEIKREVQEIPMPGIEDDKYRAKVSHDLPNIDTPADDEDLPF